MFTKNRFALIVVLLLVSSTFVFAASTGSGGRIIKRAETDSSVNTEDKADDVNIDRVRKITDVVARARELREKQGLKCGDLTDRADRVRCRLKLEDDGYNEENRLSYLPEECRAITDENKQETCINLYKKTQRCWQFPVGERRIQCVKENLGLVRSHRDEKIECKKLEGVERGKCISDLREKAYDLVKFRFYDLEERAENLKENGKVSEEDVVQLVSALEEKKIEFNNAATIREKKNIVLEVRKIWKEFTMKVKERPVKNAA